MKETVRANLLRILAVAGVSAFIYPVVLVIRTLAFNDSGGAVSTLFFYLLLAAGFVLGRLIANEDSAFAVRVAKLRPVKFFVFTFNIKEDRHFIVSAAALLTIPLPFAAAALMYYRFGILRMILEFIPAFIPFIIGLRNPYRSFNDILSRRVAYPGLLLLAVVLEFAYFYKPVLSLRPYFFIFAYFYMLVFLILKNQEDIDENIYNRRHVEKSILPGNMRGYNLRAVIVMFVGIMLLFNLKPVIMFVMNAALKVVGFVIWVIYKILEFIYNEGQSPKNQQGSQQSPLGFLGGTPDIINPFTNFVERVLLYFVLMYAAYRLIYFLIRKLPVWYKALSGLFARLFGRAGLKGLELAEDYSDEVETVIPDKNANKRRDVRNRLKNARRDLRHITDPVERVRYIYGSILGMLPAFGVKPEKSDTTCDIIIRTRAIEGMEAFFAPLTLTYDRVRYGSTTPDSGMMDEVMAYYKSVAELLKHS